MADYNRQGTNMHCVAENTKLSDLYRDHLRTRKVNSSSSNDRRHGRWANGENTAAVAARSESADARNGPGHCRVKCGAGVTAN